MPDTPSSAGRDLRDLVDPVVVMAFGGWNDAGNAATGAVEHLAESYQAEPVYALDPDDFYDFQVNRPRVALTEDDEREITWPTTELKIAQLPDGRDLILVQGLEPNLRWRQFSTLVASALSSANVTRVHLLGALLADTPHTRPIPVSVSTPSRELMTKLGLAPSTYGGQRASSAYSATPWHVRVWRCSRYGRQSRTMSRTRHAPKPRWRCSRSWNAYWTPLLILVS